MLIRESNVEEEAPINLMPLIDMVFLLLIFFLVATTFIQDELERQLQLARAAPEIQPLSALPDALMINILRDGKLKVGGKDCTRERLAELLSRTVHNDPTKKVVIRADEDSRMKYFAVVTGLCRRAGIRRANIAYLSDQTSPIRHE
jgi:biopolymer transport protein ExbD